MASLKISGVKTLRRKFADRRRKATSASTVVGYGADYALPVHEMLGAKFKTPGTGAKFLERPARDNKKGMGVVVEDTLNRGGSLSEGVYKAGQLLEAMSVRICPLNTGHLRSTSFTRRER